MSMFLRKTKHALYLRIMKLLAGLGPGASHRAFVGSGSSGELSKHILRTGVKKVLIVTDKPLRELGVVDTAIAPLLESDIDIVFYDVVLPDLTYDQVAGGAFGEQIGGERYVECDGKGAL